MDYLRHLVARLHVNSTRCCLHFALIIGGWFILVKAGIVPERRDLRYFEHVHYDNMDLLNRHQRMRRSTSNSAHLDFWFEAFGREFSVRLNKDTLTFHPEFVLETSDVSLPYDVSGTYTGYLTNEPSKVHGIVSGQGHFEGKIYTNSETFFIERSNQPASDNQYSHSIIYKLSDVIFNRNVTSCPHAQMRKRQRVLFETNAYVKTTDKNGFRAELEDSAQVPLEYNDNSGSSEDKFVHRYKRAAGPKTTCELYMQADHLFYNHYGNVETVVEKLTQYVQAANEIYNAIDFDASGSPDNIGFIIKKIKVYDNPSAAGYKYPGAYAVDYLLDLHSQDNYDDFCLSYLFTFRDFSDGVLGLAWVGDTELAGGVCQEHGEVKGVGMSLNTGVVTILNYGSVVTSAVSHVTFAHELGHNFGSSHDPEDDPVCAPGGDGGNYIMYARATSGDLPNNSKMSSCSISQIKTVLEAKATGPRGCFIEYSGQVCGNRVVEGDEECDCGWVENCIESCCNPQDTGPANPLNPPCSRKSTAVCSPSEGPCCTNVCQYSANTIRCREETGCQLAANCDGNSATCPVSGHKANTTSCGTSEDYRVCFNGECSGSVCLAYGRTACQCAPEVGGNWYDQKLCHICCMDGDVCRSSYDLTDVPDGLVQPGTPCNDFKGYCDVLRKCRSVDSSGPLSRLRNLLSSDATWKQVKDFIEERWYVPLIGGLSVIIIMVLIVKFRSKSHDVPLMEDFPPSSIYSNPQQPSTSRHPPTFFARNKIYPEGHI